MSTCEIFPPSKMKRSARCKWPPGARMSPIVQLMSAGSTAPAIFENAIAPWPVSGAANLSRRGRTSRCLVNTHHGVGIEHGDQSLEVAGPLRREEGLDHLAPLRALGNGDGS